MEWQGKINKYLPEAPGFFLSGKRPVAGFPGLRPGSQIAR